MCLFSVLFVLEFYGNKGENLIYKRKVELTKFYCSSFDLLLKYMNFTIYENSVYRLNICVYYLIVICD